MRSFMVLLCSDGAARPRERHSDRGEPRDRMEREQRIRLHTHTYGRGWRKARTAVARTARIAMHVCVSADER